MPTPSAARSRIFSDFDTTIASATGGTQTNARTRSVATQIATFALDAFGDGTLTSSVTGAQYVITDWHVVR